MSETKAAWICTNGSQAAKTADQLKGMIEKWLKLGTEKLSIEVTCPDVMELKKRETEIKKILFPVWSGEAPPPEEGCLCADCGAEVDVRGDDDEHERWDNAKDMCDQCRGEKFDRIRQLFPRGL